VPDNLKSGVRKPCYYEPDLNPTYRDLGRALRSGDHPGAPVPAQGQSQGGSGRSGRPALDRRGVAQTKFFSLDEANQAIAELLTNQPAAVPQTRGQPRHSVRAAGPAGAASLAGHALRVRRVEKPASTSTITSKSSGTITACRTRWRIRKWKCEPRRRRSKSSSRGAGHFACPSYAEPGEGNHADRTHAEGTPEICGAHAFGSDGRGATDRPFTSQLVEAILAAKRHPEMGYRSCLGILRLAKIYPAERMEAAAQRALRARAYNYQKHGIDSQEPARPVADTR
jgi:hypothetical protein